MTHLQQVESVYREWAAVYYKHAPEVIDQCALEYMGMYEKIEFVRSGYRAAWYGIVYKREKCKYHKQIYTICTVLVLKDRRGNWVRKTFFRTLSELWLTPIDGWINPKSPWAFSTHSNWAEIFETRRKVKARRASVKSLKRQWKGLE